MYVIYCDGYRITEPIELDVVKHLLSESSLSDLDFKDKLMKVIKGFVVRKVG